MVLPALCAGACGSAAPTASTAPAPASSSAPAATASPSVVPAPAGATTGDALVLDQVGPDLVALGYEAGPLTQVVPDPCVTSGGTFTARLRALGSGKPLAVSVVFTPDTARTPGSHAVSPVSASPTASSAAPSSFIGVRLASVDEGGAATDDAVSSSGTVAVDASGTSGRLEVQLVTTARHAPAATLIGPWSCGP